MDAEFVAINIAYLCYVAATIPRQIVPLRMTLIVASFAFIVYGLIADNTSIIVWNVLFAVPQIYQLVREVRRRTRVVLTPDEERVRATRFGSMPPHDFLLFWSTGEERSADGELLITEGEPNDKLVVVLSGSASVHAGGSHIADRGPGSLLGELSLVTGEPASASVRMSDAATVRVWTHEKVELLGRARPELAAALQASFARELSVKLQRSSS